MSLNVPNATGGDQPLDVACFLPLGSSASPGVVGLMGSLAQQEEWPSMGSSSREDTASDGMLLLGQVSAESVTGGSLSSTATTSPAMSASMDTDETSRDNMMNVNFMDSVVSPCTTSGTTTSSSMGHMHLQVCKRGEEGLI